MAQAISNNYQRAIETMTNYPRQDERFTAKPGAFQKALVGKKDDRAGLSQHSNKIIEDEARRSAARTLLVLQSRI